MISILYVDDQLDLLNIGKIFLEKSGEISADICPFPGRVMDKIQQKSYDAIISDYEISGIDVPTQYEFTFVTRDNHYLDSCITTGMIPKTNPSIASIIDISKLTFTKATLAESEEKFRTLAESLSLGVYIIQDKHFIYVNRYISSIFGYPDSEMYSLPIFSFFSESDNVIIRDAMERRVSGNGLTVQYLVHAKTRTGSLVEVTNPGNNDVLIRQTGLYRDYQMCRGLSE